MQLAGTDAFLLEALFRNEVWGHLCLPVSQDNEKNACTAMSSGARAAFDAMGGDDGLAAAEATIAELGPAAAAAELDDASFRRLVAAHVIRSEALSLRACVQYFATYAEQLASLEYYQERRLRGLALIDDDGKPLSFEEMLGLD